MIPVDKIMAYEAGELDRDETVELFQEMVDSGLAWQLQGSYGRTAVAYINAGLVTMRPAQLVRHEQTTVEEVTG